MLNIKAGNSLINIASLAPFGTITQWSRKGVFLLLVLVTCTASSLHEYHVSVTQIHQNKSGKTLEVSIRVFTDDLERALSENNGKRRFVINDKDQNDAFIKRYIAEHFKLVNSKNEPLQLSYLGKEAEADATWIYLETGVNTPVEGLLLTNSILTDIFDDQVNMTNLKIGSSKKTYLFKKGKTKQPL
ncbi:DUF6702 family protein [Dyadobacter jejuensis]|nr:DUF6702 family protein [Dyadobacter jejuensis]